MLGTKIGIEQAKVLAAILKEHSTLKSLCGNKGDETELNMSGKNIGAAGAIMLAPEIVDNGALSVLNLSICELWEVWAFSSGMDGSDQWWCNGAYPFGYGERNPCKEKPANTNKGFMSLCNAIKDNGALSSANLLRNRIGIDQAKALATILKEHPTLKSLCGNRGNETELDMSGKEIGVDGAIMLAPEIIDNGALSVANVYGNKIGKEQLAKLQEIMRAKPNLVSLCGIADDATEADLSGIGMDADDAIVLASELPDKGALSSLNLSANSLAPDPGTWYEDKGKYYVASTSGFITKEEAFAGVVALTNSIKDMGAMTSLNLASNELYAEGAKIIAEAIKVTKCAPEIILAPFSCPSDFSINCCCLLLSAGYVGSIRRKCHGQQDWQGTACQASGDHALQAQSCLSLRHRR
jgi:hypothetical protein